MWRLYELSRCHLGILCCSEHYVSRISLCSCLPHTLHAHMSPLCGVGFGSDWL